MTTQTPTYFQQHDFALSPVQTPFQFSNQTSLSYFDWLLAHTPLHDRFNTSLQAYRLGKSFWASWFPLHEWLIAEIDTPPSKESIFLVDVGGNTGYDLLRLHELLREQTGDKMDVLCKEGGLVLQDLPAVIDSIGEEDGRRLDTLGIRRQRYDFFTPQPIRGESPIFAILSLTQLSHTPP